MQSNQSQSHKTISQTKGEDFEKRVGKYYEHLGYEVIYHGFEKGLKDGGIDLIVKKLGEKTKYIQCKNLKKQIDYDKIAGIYGRVVDELKFNVEFVIWANNGFDYGANKFAESKGIALMSGGDLIGVEKEDNHGNTICNEIISSNDQENISENEGSKNGVVEKSVRMHLSKYQKFDGIVTTFASSKIIEDWSSGIVDTEDTVNYRTGRPKLKSIFCETIFGPIKDYECACGKYIGKKYKGIVCEKCGVELNNSKIRNIIMGHIELAVPIINPRHSLDLSIHTVLRMLPQDVEEIFATGPQALYDLLKEVDVKKDIDLLATDIRKISSSRLRKYKIKYLKGLIDLYVSGALPQDMMITKLPVIPPRFTFERIVKDGNVSGGVSVQKSSFNILYKAIIKVNNKIKKMIADKQPHIITKNKISHLQSLINYLFIGGEKLPIEGHENDKLLCFADYAKDLYNKREIDNLSYILKGLCQDVKFISNEDYNQIRISKIDSLGLSDLMEEIR